MAGLRDAGSPSVHPHDFRRLFTTELVNGGLPLHIAATLLGHLNLDTTRGYTAVFPEHLIAAHQALHRTPPRAPARRRSCDRRHGEEWAEFEQHFLLRKVALGDCHRPYGTPCVHEHACTRCRFLRVDPAQLGRIEEMTSNAEARLAEAKDRAWLGEVAALEESLKHLRTRQAEASTDLRRARTRSPTRRDNEPMKLPVMPPVSPMLAKSVATIPPGASYEPKWDGFRSICFRDGDQVELGSRNERPMTRYFPELVAAAIAELPERCVIDGEIVIATDHGLDFEALQQRIHPADSRVRMLAEQTPASFIAFDLLALGDDDYTQRPFSERRAALVDALAGSGPSIHVTPATTDLDNRAAMVRRVRGRRPRRGRSPNR